MQYVPLHVHSDASLDGAGTVQSLVKEAQRLGMSALALTDHGTLGNCVAFWSACDEAGIKPIMGLEAYLLYNAKRHHITLLALNENGFNNLIGLNTDAHVNNYQGGYPLITLDSLHNFCQDLYALSGCASSALYEGDFSQGLQYVADLRDAMGEFHVGMEVQFLGTHDTWSRPLEVANRLSLPYLVTNDTHYPCQGQFHAHQAICSARRGFTYDSQHLWLKSGLEILHEGSKWVDPDVIKLGMNNTEWLGVSVQPFNMKAPPTLPHIPGVESTLSDELLKAVRLDAGRKGKAKTRGDRLKYEWSILKTKGFLDYIYILWDIVSWAKKQGIYVGPGRGSGGGSYVLYLLGITDIDPIEYGLIFERFINPSRADYPDVDVDFEADRRQEVMNYAHDKWGTIPIATYSCYSHKSAVHDIARTLHIPKDMELPAADNTADSDAFKEFINYKPNALGTYNTMLGQIRHRGKHAAGVVIANRPVPIERTGTDGELVAAWAEGMNTKDLSKVGIVKYDILGLTALSQLKRMTELTGVHFGAVNTYDDPRVFDLFCNGDVAGIFQWSGSDGIRELTMQIAPRNFYDLTTCNALYRPGALNAGTAKDYPAFMKSPRKLHPRIDRHLEKTYGVLCYQEQVMAVVAEVMGGDLAQADLARRLLTKADVGNPKWEAEIEKLRIEFYQKGRASGLDEETVLILWHDVYTHSGYSYNLSHASAYTMISYQMAWYKVYYRVAFTTAVLQYDKANAQTYILDAIQNGVEIRMPNVEHSGKDYDMMWSTILKKHIIFLPLSDISFLGEKAIDYILEERKRNGEFKTYEEFAQRIPKKVCNNRTKGMMERIGAFTDLTGNPEAAIDKYSELELKGKYETQLEILGYVIPSVKLYQKIEEMRSRPAKKGYTRFAGFISAIEKKKSKHGDYSVYTLSPSGSFWMRGGKESLKVGVFVSGTKSHFGHSIDAKGYRLDTGV